MPIILYTTAGCHLCDLAEALLLAMPAHYQIELIHTEIGDDDDLVERYGIRIPVLQFSDGSEIGWPFEQADVVARLDAIMTG